MGFGRWSKNHRPNFFSTQRLFLLEKMGEKFDFLIQSFVCESDEMDEADCKSHKYSMLCWICN